MDRFPVLLNGKSVGELTTEREQLYTWFDLRCSGAEKGIWCAWAVGEQGELRVGILEPQGREWVIRRRFSDRMTDPLGRLLRGEIRPAGAEREQWEPLRAPERVIRTPWLRRSLQGNGAILYRREKNRLLLAIPYEPKLQFPLPQLFCFARLCQIRGKPYLQFAFDETEYPIFP